MAKKTRPRPVVGEKRWVVMWCKELAFYEGTTDVDHDSCAEIGRRVADLEAAKKLALELWPDVKTKLGVVEIEQQEFTPHDPSDAALYPHVGFWETCQAFSYWGPELGFEEL